MNIEPQILDDELRRLRNIAWRMDALFYIPRTNMSVGLDNIVGLIPVVGDALTMGPSLWIIWKARELGATPGALAYMVGNVLADMLIGSIPIVGDIFDVAYNSNIRNYRMLEKNLAQNAHRSRPVNRKRPRPILNG